MPSRIGPRHVTRFAIICTVAAAASAAELGAQQRGPDSRGPDSRGMDSLPLSRRAAVAEALAHNAQLEIAREQTAQARARRTVGVAVPDPTISAAYDQLTGPFAFGTAPAKPVSLSLSVPFPDKFRLNWGIGAADVAANESNYRLQQSTIALQASATYDTLLVALMHRDILREARTLAQDFLKRTQARFDAGTAAKLDVIQAQVGVAQAENDLIGNERDIANAQASLDRTLGRTVGAPIAPTDSLDLPPALPDSADLERIALAHRPELAIVGSQRRGAQASASLAKEFWLPDLQFSVNRDYAQPDAAVFTTGVSFPVPVLFWQHSKGDIALAEHYERELDATYRDTEAQVRQDVRSAYANASTAMRQAAFLRDQLVPAAREAYRVASTAYSLGSSSALEVLTARTTLLQAQSQLADALADANTARADLDRALGITASTGAAR